jgi:hypothetical protein
MRRILSIIISLSVFFFIFQSTVSAATTKTIIHPDLATSFPDVVEDPSRWFLYNDENDTIDSSLGTFVDDPTPAPAGNGSLKISVSGSQRRNIATYQFGGTPLAEITNLRYHTYNPSAGNGGGVDRAGYLQFNVDFNASDTWQRRLIFLPRENGAVVQDTWQEWDAINNGDAVWGWSGYFSNGGKWPDGNTTQYRTWSDLIAAFPSIRVRVTDSWLGIRVGEPYTNGYTEYIDAFVWGDASGVTTFDFEPALDPPTTIDQCRSGKWKQYNNPPFQRQGTCIQYVLDHAYTIKGSPSFPSQDTTAHTTIRLKTAHNAGIFRYVDKNGDRFLVHISSVKSDGESVWFAGKIKHTNNPVWKNKWIFAKGQDKRHLDNQIWLSITDQTTATAGVESMTIPVDGPFAISRGGIHINNR